MSIVTLKDGYQIPSSALGSITLHLKVVAQTRGIIALVDLVEKCKNAAYEIKPHSAGNKKKLLKAYALINEDESVPEAVKRVVLNSIVVKDNFLQFVSPLKQ